ncbi:hypothetical protein KXW24_006425 [Aspergillus fumigatus]|nr:hypothetical protein KXW24_006425 [Aspergillus fumigatus]
MPFKQHDGKIYRIAALLAFHVVFIISVCPRQSSAAGDVFLFPPQSGYTGEYISNLAFTVGQSIDIKWKSGCDESIQFWLMKDSNGGDCQFQRDARCSQIAETPNNGSTAWNRPGLDPFQLSLLQYYVEASFHLDDGAPSHGHYPGVNDAEPPSRPYHVDIDIPGTRRNDKVNDPSGSMPQTWRGKAESPEATPSGGHELPCPESSPGSTNQDDQGPQSPGNQRRAPIELPS